MNTETKQESSIPVQCRISIVTLAGLSKYWESSEYHIKTISQLMSWSLYLLAEILASNGKMGREPSVEEARDYLMHRGLFQKSSLDRGLKKITAAIRFEGLRRDGETPSGINSNPEDRAIYNRLHREPNRLTGESSSVQPFDGVAGNERLDEARRVYANLKPEDIRPIVSGDGVVGTGSVEERMKRNKELEERQAAEMDRFIAAAKAEKSI